MSDARDVVWRRRADVPWRRSLDAVVLFPAGADEPLSLPGTGAAVWDPLEAPITLAELQSLAAATPTRVPVLASRDPIHRGCSDARRGGGGGGGGAGRGGAG